MRNGDDIGAEITRSMDGLTFSKADKERMIRRLLRKEEDVPVKKLNLRKTAIAAAVCAMAVGGTVFAAEINKPAVIISHSSSADEVKDFSELEKLEKEVGVDINYTESFDDTGFSFDSAVISHAESRDDDDNSLAKWQELNIHYSDESGRRVYLSAEPEGLTGEISDENAVSKRDIGGTTVRYSQDEYLFLPPSAEKEGISEELVQREKDDPHFYISYGSDKEETKFFTSVQWAKDGVLYLISSFDGVSEDELFSMASELIG